MRQFLVFFLLGLSINLFSQDIRENTTIDVNGDKFTFMVLADTVDHMCVLSIKREDKLILKDTLEDFHDYGEFVDFDGDGYVDFISNRISQITWAWLYKYDTVSDSYLKIKGFEQFNDPQALDSATGYYYSYRKNGCADAAWFSDLFVLRANQAVRIARINGKGCLPEEEAYIEIKVYLTDGTKILETLPLESIHSHENGKWGFIKDYWNENIEKFK